jgi:hypothetical protein
MACNTQNARSRVVYKGYFGVIEGVVRSQENSTHRNYGYVSCYFLLQGIARGESLQTLLDY